MTLNWFAVLCTEKAWTIFQFFAQATTRATRQPVRPFLCQRRCKWDCALSQWSAISPLPPKTTPPCTFPRWTWRGMTPLTSMMETTLWQRTKWSPWLGWEVCAQFDVKPPCAIACINICVHVKNPTHCQPYHCLNTQKYHTLPAIPLFEHTNIPHRLIGMGSVALAAAVPYPGKATRISRQWQRSIWTILIIQSPWLLTIISPRVLHKDWFRMSGHRVDDQNKQINKQKYNSWTWLLYFLEQKEHPMNSFFSRKSSCWQKASLLTVGGDFFVQFHWKNQHARELISARKMSHKQFNLKFQFTRRNK